MNMITTLTGENAFGLRAELDKLVGDFVGEQGDLALERIDAEEAELPRIQEALTNLPFLASRKLVVLRAPSSNKNFVEQHEQLLSDIPETTDVILLEPKLDKRLSYYKFLKSKTDWREFQALDSNGLASWLVQRAKAHNAALNSSDARYLVERVGTDQQFLGNELDKLVLYDPKISRETIDLLTDPTPQSTIFELLEAAFAGQGRKVLKLYAEQRAQKVEAPQIIALLAWQLHILALLKTAGDRTPDQIAQQAKVNPFVVRKSQGIARNITLPELRSKIQELVQLDVKSKRTNLDTDAALQDYLLTLSN